MKLIKSDILENFKTYDDRVKNNLSLIIDELILKKTQVSSYLLIILELLATQYTIYYRALDAVNTSTDLTGNDSQKRKSKIPELSALQKAYTEIIRLLDKLALSPIEDARLKRLKEKSSEEEANEAYDELYA
jgi:phage terminase small subunit